MPDSDSDDVPELVKEENSSDEGEWSDEENEPEESVTCLFCTTQHPQIDAALDHMRTAHNFNLQDVKSRHSMDFYSYVKMISFIRHTKIADPKDLFTPTGSPQWLDDKYLKPPGDYEPWLSYDFDQLEVSQDPVTSSESENLRKIIADLQEQLQVKDQMLEQAAHDMNTMKESYKRLLLKEPDIQNITKSNGVASVDLESDAAYFDGYAHFSIHHTMLSDRVRTDSYRDAIMKNSRSIKDKTVLDIGCGTGILSLFASQAGAKDVFAVDQSDIIYHAMQIAQVNDFRNVHFIKGRLEDAPMPFEKVDVIVSEWMGYFLLFEGMLDSVIYGRDRYLRDGGLLLPNRCNISIAGYGSEERYRSFIQFFDDVYGFNMKCIMKDILREGHVEQCESENVLTKPNVVCDLDLMTCDLDYSNFSYDFQLEVTKDAKMTAIVGYFDTFFELEEKIVFSTSPGAEPTHWKQVLFYLDEPVEVKVGQVICGNFKCQRDRKDARSLVVEMRVFGKSFRYNLE